MPDDILAPHDQLRREQIRRAQRTYRLRRDSKLHTLEAAHAELTAKYERMERSFLAICEEAAKCDPQTCGPTLAAMIRDSAAQFFGDRQPARNIPSSSSSPSPLPCPAPFPACSGSDVLSGETSPGHTSKALQTFGYAVSHGAEPGAGTALWSPPSFSDGAPSPCAGSPCSGSPLNLVSLAPPTSYSFLEATFARRLHRRSLEFAYHLFDDPRADPQLVYRMFRLVGCFRDREKMRPFFQRLVRSGPGQRLEIFGMPFYCIGGAGTHYPKTGEMGNPEVPLNLRLPKRILGRTPDGSAAFEGEAYAECLSRMGYGGVWLDSYEVECYLNERGLFPRPHSFVVPMLQSCPASPSDYLRLEEEVPQAQSPPEMPENSETITATAAGSDHDSRGSPDSAEPISTNGPYFDVDRFLEREYLKPLLPIEAEPLEPMLTFFQVCADRRRF